MPRPVTIQDVADRAKVSTGTVSRVLTGRKDVNADTRRAVVSAIRDTGFSPKVTSGTRNTIGLLVQPKALHFHQPFVSQYLQGMFQAAFAAGYELTLVPVDWSETLADDILISVLQKGVRGIIMPQQMVDAGGLDVFRNHDLRIVVFHGQTTAPGVGWVDCNSHDIMYRALSTFYEYGYRRVMMVGRAGRFNYSVQERVRAFREFAARTDVVTEFYDPGKIPTDALAQEFVARLGAPGFLPVGITGTNSDFVLALYKAVAQAALDPAGRVGIIGVDNEYYYPYLNPPVSTIVHPIEEMGRQAVEMAIGMINGQEARGVMLESDLVLRRSLAPAIQG